MSSEHHRPHTTNTHGRGGRFQTIVYITSLIQLEPSDAVDRKPLGRYTAIVATLDLGPTNARIPEDAYRYIIRCIARGCSIPIGIELAARTERWGRLPSPDGVIAWAQETPERSKLYALARETAAELGAAELQHIADSALDGVTDDPGTMNAKVGHARLKLDARKWTAAKMLPHRYGDRIAHEHSGNVTISLDTGIRRIDGPIIDASIRNASLLDDAPTSLLADASDASESIAPMVRAVSLLD